jgi:hypothetical protein
VKKITEKRRKSRKKSKKKRNAMSNPPPIECERCESIVKINESILTPDTERVCKSCATEGEMEAWQEYVDEMESRMAEAQEKGKYRRGGEI